MMIEINNKRKIELEYEIGEIVYLITDEDQSKRMVTGYYIGPSCIFYCLTGGTSESKHFAIEISRGKDYQFN